MPALKNIRHERFCLLYLISGNASEAYREAGFKSKEVDGNASRLIVKDSICKRLAEIKAQNALKIALTRDEALSVVAEIARGPRDEFISAGDQLRAVEVASRMCGWNEPDQVRLSATDTLSSYLLDLRAKPIGGQVLELLENGSPNP